MNQLVEWLSRVFGSWKFWVVVPPWDVGVRVRLGKYAVELVPGFHFRVPFVDDVTLVNTRLRITTTPPVTIEGTEGRARVISAAIGYRISDPLVAMLAYEQPMNVLMAYAQAEVAMRSTADKCLAILREVFCPHGIEVEFVRFVEDVDIPALRLLQNGWGVSDSLQVPTAPPVTQARY